MIINIDKFRNISYFELKNTICEKTGKEIHEDQKLIETLQSCRSEHAFINIRSKICKLFASQLLDVPLKQLDTLHEAITSTPNLVFFYNPFKNSPI